MGLYSPYPQVKNKSAANAQELMEHEAVADKKCEHPEQFLKMTNDKVMSRTYTELFLGIKQKKVIFTINLRVFSYSVVLNNLIITLESKGHTVQKHISSLTCQCFLVIRKYGISKLKYKGNSSGGMTEKEGKKRAFFNVVSQTSAGFTKKPPHFVVDINKKYILREKSAMHENKH